jgi:hypothetical protein
MALASMKTDVLKLSLNNNGVLRTWLVLSTSKILAKVGRSTMPSTAGMLGEGADMSGRRAIAALWLLTLRARFTCATWESGAESPTAPEPAG